MSSILVGQTSWPEYSGDYMSVLSVSHCHTETSQSPIGDQYDALQSAGQAVMLQSYIHAGLTGHRLLHQWHQTVTMIHNTDIYVITSIWASQIRNFKYFYFIITLPATLKLWELTNFGQGVFRVSCKNIASHADNLWFYQFWNWTIKIVSINCALVFCDWLIWLVVASDHNVLHN